MLELENGKNKWNYDSLIIYIYMYAISMISSYHYFIYKFEPSDHDEMHLMQLNIE